MSLFKSKLSYVTLLISIIITFIIIGPYAFRLSWVRIIGDLIDIGVSILCLICICYYVSASINIKSGISDRVLPLLYIISMAEVIWLTCIPVVNILSCLGFQISVQTLWGSYYFVKITETWVRIVLIILLLIGTASTTLLFADNKYIRQDSDKKRLPNITFILIFLIFNGWILANLISWIL